MKLIIAEKNDAARQIAERLSTGKPKKDKVYNTAIYRFEWKGEECVTIGCNCRCWKRRRYYWLGPW